MSEPTTPVVFRIWQGLDKTGDDCIALFPTVEHCWPLCSSYEHVGQHGGTDYAECISRTRPAKAHEYADLKRELESAPDHYNLKIYKRRPNYE